MKIQRKVLFAVLLTFCAISVSAIARKVPPWFRKPGELARRSDLIVVASPIASKMIGAATNEIHAGFDGRDSWGTFVDTTDAVPTETTFRIEEVLKGETSTNTMVLFHYTWDPKPADLPMGRFNPPDLVSFTEHLKYREGTLIANFRRPKYLLFLNRMPDGRFRATTGQVDPALSVHLLVQQYNMDNLVSDYLSLIEESRKKESENIRQESSGTQSSNTVESLPGQSRR